MGYESKQINPNKVLVEQTVFLQDHFSFSSKLALALIWSRFQTSLSCCIRCHPCANQKCDSSSQNPERLKAENDNGEKGSREETNQFHDCKGNSQYKSQIAKDS